MRDTGGPEVEGIPPTTIPVGKASLCPWLAIPERYLERQQNERSTDPRLATTKRTHSVSSTIERLTNTRLATT